MLKIAVLVSGGGTNLQAIIDAIDNGKITNAKIVKVISNTSKAYALERAKNHGIDTAVVRKKDWTDNSRWEKALAEEIENSGADLVVLAGFLCVLSADFTSKFPDRIINVHPSLIPSFCGEGFYGLKVHEAALTKGVKITGATVHFVNEQVDGGRIIAQKAVRVLPGDTPQVLQKRVMEQAEWVILPRAIDDIANNRL